MDGDFYEREGVLYDRPTVILDYFAPPELVKWKMKVGAKEAGLISRRALKHGSSIDEIIRENREPTKKDSEEVKNCYLAYKKWKEHYEPKVIEFPGTGYCEVRMVAGTPDIYWRDKEDLIDVKSSKSVHENYFFQLGFYASVMKEPIKRLAVLRLDKLTGDYEYVTNDSIGLSVADCINGFNGLLLYYRKYKQAHKGINKGKIPEEL